MKKNTSQILSIVAAGKLIASSNFASAEGIGKLQIDPNSPLSVDQIGYPLDILTPPIDSTTDSDSGGKINSAESGLLFAEATGKALDSGKQPRIDFIINHIQNINNSVVVFLAYSTVRGNPSQWQDLQLNSLFLDRATTRIISAFIVEPKDDFDFYNASPASLGNVKNEQGNSLIVSLNLADLGHPDFAGDNIYFQAVSVPFIDNQLIFSAANISELDHYKIARRVEGQDGSGSKNTDIGSKSNGGDNDSNGGK